MKKYNLSEIMHKAWKLYRKGVGSFAEALHRAWNSAKAAPVNAQRIEEAQQTAGITEPVNNMGGLESRRVHGGAWCKGPVSGGAYPQQQGRWPDLPRIVLRCIAGEAAGSTVTRIEDPRREDGSPPGMMGGYDHEDGEENQLARL